MIAGGAMTDAAFAAFVARCRAELAEKQTKFQRRIEGSSTWSYDLQRGELRVGAVPFPIAPIGTLNASYGTWLWAWWANDSLPEVARTRALGIQALQTTTGFQVFVIQGLPTSPGEANDLTALAVHQLGAVGVFRVPWTEATLFLAVFDPLG
jgi:hypothetical protein